MKVIQISIHRYMKDTEEPVMLCEVADLTSFGFFQVRKHGSSDFRRHFHRYPTTPNPLYYISGLNFPRFFRNVTTTAVNMSTAA